MTSGFKTSDGTDLDDLFYTSNENAGALGFKNSAGTDLGNAYTANSTLGYAVGFKNSAGTDLGYLRGADYFKYSGTYNVWWYYYVNGASDYNGFYLTQSSTDMQASPHIECYRLISDSATTTTTRYRLYFLISSIGYTITTITMNGSTYTSASALRDKLISLFGTATRNNGATIAGTVDITYFEY